MPRVKIANREFSQCCILYERMRLLPHLPSTHARGCGIVVLVLTSACSGTSTQDQSVLSVDAAEDAADAIEAPSDAPPEMVDVSSDPTDAPLESYEAADTAEDTAEATDAAHEPDATVADCSELPPWNYLQIKDFLCIDSKSSCNAAQDCAPIADRCEQTMFGPIVDHFAVQDCDAGRCSYAVTRTVCYDQGACVTFGDGQIGCWNGPFPSLPPDCGQVPDGYDCADYSKPCTDPSTCLDRGHCADPTSGYVLEVLGSSCGYELSACRYKKTSLACEGGACIDTTAGPTCSASVDAAATD